ncbi:MAG: ferrochelatase [Simkaniaceae bacterium]|nr:ferrochelatase [Simkaniaceae bacterium]MCF7852252.1 ferrochelatase [Simkaniaceae bacterium]
MTIQTAILLVNLGSPDSPNPGDVKKYLMEFLLDPDVIDAPWLIRQFLVRRVIIPRRYLESARSYQKIWTQEGSPLVSTMRQLTGYLKEKMEGDALVEFAMRYQNPSIDSVLDQFKEQGIEHLIVLPMFPQYADATTGSIYKKITNRISTWNRPPKLNFIEQFCSFPQMIDVFVENGAAAKEYDHVLFSFHGLPEKQLKMGDSCKRCLNQPNCCENRPLKENCYRAHCLVTGKAIAERLHLSDDQMTIAFQSRLGKDKWLEPYASEEIVKLARSGVKSLLVFSPSFTCDCLETLFEINIEYKALFQKHGGERLDLVESLNCHPHWIKGLEEMLKKMIFVSNPL